MIRCGFCNTLTTPGEPTFKVVIEWREKIYPRREDANKFKREGKIEFSADPGGTGIEIAKELSACKSCNQMAIAEQEKQDQEQQQEQLLSKW